MTSQTITQADFDTFLATRREPAWVTEARIAAWNVFREMSLPERTDEEWRRTDLRGFGLDRFALPGRPTPDLPTPRALLSEGVEQFILNSLAIRKASRPGQGAGFRPDGFNLPWVVAELERNDPERLREWVGHLSTALPDLQAIHTVEREDDRHQQFSRDAQD